MFQRYVISFDVRVPTEKKREREEKEKKSNLKIKA